VVEDEDRSEKLVLCRVTKGDRIPNTGLQVEPRPMGIVEHLLQSP
jgi:hypothetical protein